MRSIIRASLSGVLLAVAAGSGCSDLDSEGQGGRAGAAGTGGDAGIDVSTNGGSSGGPPWEGGADADSDVTDGGSEVDSAAAMASCKAAADGAACTTCACEHCIEYISECNKDRRCRAVLECAAQSGCKHTQQCWDMCRDVIFAAEDAVYYASMASNCRTEKCATACRASDVDAAAEGGSPDAADAESSDGTSDASSDAPDDAAQE